MVNLPKVKTAYEIGVRLVGSEMCIRDRFTRATHILKEQNVDFEEKVLAELILSLIHI